VCKVQARWLQSRPAKPPHANLSTPASAVGGGVAVAQMMLEAARMRDTIRQILGIDLNLDA
jgi:hypothetical protein